MKSTIKYGLKQAEQLGQPHEAALEQTEPWPNLPGIPHYVRKSGYIQNKEVLMRDPKSTPHY